MFKNCKDIKSIFFNVANECDCMDNMFSGCNSIENINLSNFNTNFSTSMKSMFNECKSLKTLDMPNFDTSSVTNMEKMFNECNLIEEIKFSNYFKF